MSSGKCFYCRTWMKNLFSIQALTAVLSSFGVLWLVVEISTFFLSGTGWPDRIRQWWLYFGLVGLGAAAWECRPHLSVAAKLNGRDVTIEVAVGDLFDFTGAYIVGTNTTFDTRISRELISEKSVQGAFTRKFYGEETQLDRELTSGLVGIASTDLNGSRLGKARRYPIGTCVRLNPRTCTAYFLAIAEINEHGVASGNFNDLKESLAKLWVFIGERGLKESLVMPVLGTGFSRLRQTREEIIREIVQSFIAACSERTFADKLTIVITPHDMRKHGISLDELGCFLRHECHYVSFSTGVQQPTGTPA